MGGSVFGLGAGKEGLTHWSDAVRRSASTGEDVDGKVDRDLRTRFAAEWGRLVVVGEADALERRGPEVRVHR